MRASATDSGRELCVNCGYDLAGIADVERCPECGMRAAASRRAGVWGLSAEGLRGVRVGAAIVGGVLFPGALVGMAVVAARLNGALSGWTVLILAFAVLALWTMGWVLIERANARAGRVPVSAGSVRAMNVAGFFCFGLGLIGLVVGNGDLVAWMGLLGVVAFALSLFGGLAFVARLAAASAEPRLRASASAAAVTCGPLLGISLVLGVASAGADAEGGALVWAVSLVLVLGAPIWCAAVMLRLAGLAKRVQRARATRWRGNR